MSIDVANSIADSWFRLGFLSATELNTGDFWVTAAELYQFGDDAAKKLAYSVGIFSVTDASISVVSGTSSYSLPAAHVFTLLGWIVYSGQPLQLLRPTTVGQLFALDGNWATTTGSSNRISFDAGSVGTATLYPQPIQNGTLNQICQEFQSVALSASTLTISPALRDMLTYALLAGARGKEGDSRMAEMADHFQKRVDMYMAVCDHLWGPGQ